MTQPLTPSRAKFAIPHEQLNDWMRESEKARQYVLNWIAVLAPLEHVKGREKEFAAIARQIGSTPGTVRKKYYAYLAGKNGKCFPFWEKIVDRAKFPAPDDRNLDIRFIEHWKRLRENSKRLKDGAKQAHRDLLSDLSLWEKDPTNNSLKIPGYSTPPPRSSFCAVTGEFVPAGWSYSNLSNHKPREYNLVNIITGPKAASTLLPSNLATRVGVRYREIVFSDDQDYDNEVVSYLNGGKAMRPQGFNTLDYLTANFETTGIQLRRLDDEGKKRGINQEFYVWTVLTDLMLRGFRDDERGTRLIREHATAKGYAKLDGYGDDFDTVINHITGGRVKMDASGRFDQSMFSQMLFRGKGRGKQASGNFRYKAPLESAFHRVRTNASNLLGDTGNRYQVYPEHNEPLDRYSQRVFKAIEKLPYEKREITWELLRHHKHTFHEFSYLQSLVYLAVNRRRDHKIEGWGEAGFIIPGYSIVDPTNPEGPPRIISRDQFAELPGDQQHYIKTFGKNHNIVLCPEEAAQICRRSEGKKIVKLGRDIAVNALPISWAYPKRKGKEGGVKVQANGTLVIRDPERFGTDSLVYLATAHVPGGDRIDLRPKEQYLVHVCPFDPEEAILLTLDGRYRGYVKLMPKPTATDVETRLRNQGMIEEYRANISRASKRRHEPEVQRNRDIIDHNDRVLSGDIAPSDEDIENERRRQHQEKSHEDFDNGVITVVPNTHETRDNGQSEPRETNKFSNLFAYDPEIDDDDNN